MTATMDILSETAAVPVRCFTGDALAPDAAARRQLQRLAAVPGLARYVAVLPDVHAKSRNPTPTGTVVVTRDRLIPRAIDHGVGCGMSMLATSVPAAEFGPRTLDELFCRLKSAVPVKVRDVSLLGGADVEQVLGDGLASRPDLFGLKPADMARVENRGRWMGELSASEILDAVPGKAIRKAATSLGTLGAGNHFLELQEIVEVLDGRAAGLLGLELGNAFVMLHSDSRRLGKKLLEPAMDEAQRAAGGDNGDPLWTVPVESDSGRRLVAAMAATVHAAMANRAAIGQIVRRTLCEVMGDTTLDLPLVFDCSHETIQPETHDGERHWVHRHGASRALPAAALGSDAALSEIGQPVPVPGSMGTDSYVAVARPGAARTFHSVAHGAGRVIEKAVARETFRTDEVEEFMHSRNVRLYRYGVDEIAGQMPSSFKDPAGVVQAMTQFGLIRPVVRLRPMAVLKG
jgi:tRNA-splicing ligase RtcB